ncbi:hypothetical protein CMI37_14415 [Candidatus Pacearchaeota archaeon]|nr:hypothetical protein [Candidatus Pacearchaeota archaeon]
MMRCYKCNSPAMPLAPLTEEESTGYPLIGWVLRRCASCGLEQNHVGDTSNEEPLDPWEAALDAPVMGNDGLIVPSQRVWSLPSEQLKAERKQREDAAVVEITGTPPGSLSVAWELPPA